jgi:hypothetical protein
MKKIEKEDDLLLNPHAVKCTAEVQNALKPHKRVLMKLSLDPNAFEPTEVPALSFKAAFYGQTPSMFTGGLLDNDLAAVLNWIYTNIPQAERLYFAKMLDLTIAHARTLLLAYRYSDELADGCEEGQNVAHYTLQKAWKRLYEWTGLSIDGRPKQCVADVNFEAVELLDKIMFDKSERAGVAGNHQWGLDVGPHEGGRDPQFCGPSVTTGKVREGNDDDEIVVCMNFPQTQLVTKA